MRSSAPHSRSGDRHPDAAGNWLDRFDEHVRVFTLTPGRVLGRDNKIVGPRGKVSQDSSHGSTISDINTIRVVALGRPVIDPVTANIRQR